MKKAILILLSLVLLAACQPTPEEETVINKTEGRLEQTIEGSGPVPAYTEETAGSLRASVGAPEHEADSFSGKVFGGTMDVTVDADVFVPSVSTVPVYRVALGGYSAEEKEKMVKSLIGDGPYYHCNRNERTYLENELNYRQAWLNALDEQPYGPNADYAEYREILADDIMHRQESYQTAEAEAKTFPCTCQWSDSDGHVSDRDASFDWYASSSRWCSLSYYHINDPYYIVSAYHALPRNEEEQQAVDAASAFLSILNDTDVRMCGIAAHDEDYRQSNGVETGFNNGVYLLAFRPYYNGIPVYDFRTFHGSDNGLAEAEVHYDYDAPQESISVVVANNEVRRADWQCPLHILGVDNENVTLLPFDRIMEICRKQLFMNIYIGHDWDGNDSRTDLRITQIILSYLRVRKPNDDTYWLLPVWDFRGYIQREYNGDSIPDWFDHYTLLTVNAVDGSIIDRDLGY